MLRPRIRRAIARCLILCLLALHTHAAATAADLDGKKPQARQDALAEFVARHDCRRIPQPQTDLWGQVVTYLPTWVCQSRGLYADTFDPPPLPRY